MLPYQGGKTADSIQKFNVKAINFWRLALKAYLVWHPLSKYRAVVFSDHRYEAWICGAKLLLRYGVSSPLEIYCVRSPSRDGLCVCGRTVMHVHKVLKVGKDYESDRLRWFETLWKR